MPSLKRDRSPGTSQEEHGSGYSTSPAAAVGADRGVTGFPRANPTENEYGSGYISTPAAASGAASSRDGFPHTPQPAAEYGSGYGLDLAAANGASGVSARFPHTHKPSSDRKRRKHQPPQLDSGEGPSTVNVLEANAGTPQFSQVSPSFSLLGANLSDNYPWLRFVPDRLRHRLIPTLAPGDFAPGPVLILLYAGRDDPLSLDSCIHAHYPRLSPHIVAFDTLRPPQALGHDLLADQPYGYLCQAAIDGRVRLVGGGPNCRTWSILRWFPKPNAPPPVRGRSEDLVWGLEALQPSEQQDVDNDSLLVLRLMFLIALMKQHTQQPTASFLEHPQDPVECSGSPSAHRCSSLWATKVFRAWQASVGHHLVKFDQCRLGQLVAKSTTLSSDLDICCWDGLKCNHPDHVLPEDMKSSDLSRYPPPMATPVGRHNYDSAEEFSDAIKQTFEEERLLDMVEGPFTKQEAANRCSCSPSQFCPGPMAAIDEGDKIRTIYDGSFGGANSHIQQNTSEKTTAPTVMDCMHGIHWINAAASLSPGDHTAVSQGERATASGVDSSSQGGGTWSWPGPDTALLILKADVSKAHRRIKILPSGWKYQVAQIDQQWWVNKVGTYGVASAQLYWGRMAALLLRLLYYSFPEVDWGFVFVDDFCWLLRSTNCNSLTPALLAFLVALGVPLSWKKTVLSEINTWLGFVINPSGPFVQMARDKHVIVLSLLQDLASGKVFSTEKALGRIQWATATCPLAKPFLQPFWQWKSACKNAGQPGKLVRCLAVLLSELFSRQFPQMSPFSPWSDWTGASDASAEPFGTTWIGGWLSDLNTPTKDQVYWFQYQLTQASHPWAFKQGDPQKRIAAIELYGTLFLVLLLMSKQPTAACRLHIPLISDNQGNVYSILNNATRKMPNAVILMELVYQIYQAGHMLAPTHSKRDDNQWADELTHPSPKGFSPALKVDIVPLFSKFALIPKLLESSDSESWFDTRTHP